MPNGNDEEEDLAAILRRVGAGIGAGLAAAPERRRQEAREAREKRALVIQQRQANLKTMTAFFNAGKERNIPLRDLKLKSIFENEGGDVTGDAFKSFKKIFDDRDATTLQRFSRSFTELFKNLDPAEFQSSIQSVIRGELPVTDLFDRGEKMSLQKKKQAAFAPTPGLPSPEGGPGGQVSRAEAAQRLRAQGLLEEARKVEGGAREERAGVAGVEATQALTAQRRTAAAQARPRATTRTEVFSEVQLFSQGIGPEKPQTPAGRAISKLPKDKQGPAAQQFVDSLIKADPLSGLLRQQGQGSQAAPVGQAPSAPTPAQDPQQGILNRLFGGSIF